MAGEHPDLEGWGVYSIFKESGRLLYQHIRILRPFVLAFLLPIAFILFLEVIGIAWVLASVAWLTRLVQPHHFGGLFGHYHYRHSGFHAFHAAFQKAPNPFQPNSYPFILFITWLLISLVSVTIAKAIHHIYSQNTTSSTTTSRKEEKSSSSFQILILILIHSIFITLSHFIYGIFIISLCFLVVHIFTYVILALPFYLFLGPQLFPCPLETINIWFSYFFFLILDSWFEVTTQVAALEVY